MVVGGGAFVFLRWCGGVFVVMSLYGVWWCRAVSVVAVMFLWWCAVVFFGVVWPLFCGDKHQLKGKRKFDPPDKKPFSSVCRAYPLKGYGHGFEPIGNYWRCASPREEQNEENKD